MAWVLIVLVLAFPVVEIAVFVKAAQSLGVLTTVFLAVLAGMAGLALVRAQGLRTLFKAKSLADRGEMPVAEMFDGICLALAGGLLLLPGFVSDLMAIALLLPPVRALLALWLSRHLTVVAPQGVQPEVIDGEYRVVEPESERLKRE